MMKTRTLSLLAGLLAAAPVAGALADDEMPAIRDEQPAVSTPPVSAPGQAPRTPPAAEPGVVQGEGMSVIGEQESPIGLYIMPWRQSAASSGLDRPARLLDDTLRPLDPEVFKRQFSYYDALSRHLEKKGLVTPE